MNSGAVVSSTVMVWVAEELFPVVGGREGANDHVVASGIAAVVSLDTSMVTSPQLSDAVASSIGISSSTLRCSRQDEGEPGAVVSSTVMVWVAEELFPASSVA